MRKLEQSKCRLVFETANSIYEQGRGRRVIIEARPQYARVHLKGMRSSFSISYAAIYHAAAKLAVETARAEKRAAKAGAR